MLAVLTVQVGMGVACDMHELQRDYKDEVEFQPQVSSSCQLLPVAPMLQ